MRCMTESFGSKNFFMTASQPPNFVMSNCFGGSGYVVLVDERVDHRAVALRGEDPLRGLGGREVDERLRLGAAPASVAAIGFSMRIVSSGMT